MCFEVFKYEEKTVRFPKQIQNILSFFKPSLGYQTA